MAEVKAGTYLPPNAKSIVNEWYDLEFFAPAEQMDRADVLDEYGMTEEEYTEFLAKAKQVSEATFTGEIPVALLPDFWEYLQSVEDADWFGKNERQAEREVGILLGYYREYTEADAQSLVLTRNGTRKLGPDFRMNGKKWIYNTRCDRHGKQEPVELILE